MVLNWYSICTSYKFKRLRYNTSIRSVSRCVMLRRTQQSVLCSPKSGQSEIKIQWEMGSNSATSMNYILTRTLTTQIEVALLAPKSRQRWLKERRWLAAIWPSATLFGGWPWSFYQRPDLEQVTGISHSVQLNTMVLSLSCAAISWNVEIPHYVPNSLPKWTLNGILKQPSNYFQF
jgi:hypothetical protein